MSDRNSTDLSLREEVGRLRRRVAELEAREAESRRATDSLRKSEETNRALLAAVPDLMFRVRIDGTFLGYTGRTDFLYVAPELFIGKTFHEVLPPEVAEPLAASTRKAGVSGNVELCEYALEIEGERRWWEARVVGCGAGELLCVIREITDRKRAEEALRRSEQRLSLHFQQTPLAAIEWDIEGKVRTWNPSAERIFGYSQEEARGRSYSFIVPRHSCGNVDQMWTDLHGAKGGQRSTNENITKDGRAILCEWYNTPLIDTEGRVIGVTSLAQDTTEQKRAEAMIEAEHATLVGIINSTSHPIFSVDEDYRYTSFNKSHAATMKAIYGSDIELGKSILQCMTVEDDRRKAKINLDRTLRGEEFVLNSYSGEEARSRPWFQVSHNPIMNAQGRAVGAAIFAQDITDRKLAEEALRDSAERLRQAARAANLGVFEHDHRTDVLQWSPEMRQLYGVGPDEPINFALVLDSFHPEDRGSMVDAIERAHDPRGDGIYSADSRIIRRDGEVRWLIRRSKTFFENDSATAKAVRTVGVVMDITDRKRAEEALEKARDELERKVRDRTAQLAASEERYALAVRGAGVGIWDYDVCTGKVYYSPRWKQMFGFDEHDISDSMNDWAKLLHPDERDWIIKFQEDFLASNESTVSVEYRLRHKDGEYRWIVAHGLAVRDENGRAVRLVGSHGDITDRKRAEEALRREHLTLKHLLQSSDHERQLIAYEIHDGLAQQLAGAIMQFQTFDHLKDTKPALAAKAYEAGFTMLQQGHYETRRLIAGVRPPVLDESGIVEAVAHLVNEQNRLRQAKIELRSDVKFDRLVPTQENAIYRIVQEGLTNACQHSRSQRIRVSLSQHEDQVRIEIRDWGIGFEPKAVPKNHFGLDGIRQRARLLDGKCKIESSQARGTRIVVELPAVPRSGE